MRVALVTNLLTHYRLPLYEELARRLDMTFYFTRTGVGRYALPEYEQQSEVLPTRQLRSRVSVYAEMRRQRYDCVVLSLTDRVALPFSVAGARTAGSAVVVWVGIWEHPRTVVHRLSRPLARTLYRTADSLLVYGDHVRQFVRAESGRTNGVFVAPQAADTSAFASYSVTETPQECARDENSPYVCLYVGRLEEEKGLSDLIRAIAAVPAWRLVIVGRGSRTEELQSLVRAERVEDRVGFVGYVDRKRLPAYFASADALALPSVSTKTFREPWGLVVNEAFASSVPALVTDAVGAAAGGLAVDGETAVVVPQGSPASLAEALRRLEDDAFRRTLGERGRERVSGYSFAAAADAFEDAIEFARSSR